LGGVKNQPVSACREVHHLEKASVWQEKPLKTLMTAGPKGLQIDVAETSGF
jgi:hypothetical protein